MTDEPSQRIIGLPSIDWYLRDVKGCHDHEFNHLSLHLLPVAKVLRESPKRDAAGVARGSQPRFESLNLSSNGVPVQSRESLAPCCEHWKSNLAR